MVHDVIEQPTVQVIMLTYNHENLIEQAVESVMAQQTTHPFHVTIHDDASSDRTPEILRGLAQRWPDRISLVMRETNGMSQGINPSTTSILATSGKYVAWCEGDDWWTDTSKLQKQVDFMEDNPWCAISHHGVEIAVDPGGSEEYAEKVRDIERAQWRRQPRVDGIELARQNFIFTCSAMMRRSAVTDRCLRAVYDVMPGDWVTLALAAESGDVGFIDECMAAYRIHGDNFWATAGNQAERDAAGDKARWFLGTYTEGRLRPVAQRAAIDQWLRENPHPLTEEVERLQMQVAEHQAAAQATQEHLDQLATQLREQQELLSSIEQSRGWRLLERLRTFKRLG